HVKQEDEPPCTVCPAQIPWPSISWRSRAVVRSRGRRQRAVAPDARRFCTRKALNFQAGTSPILNTYAVSRRGRRPAARRRAVAQPGQVRPRRGRSVRRRGGGRGAERGRL